MSTRQFYLQLVNSYSKVQESSQNRRYTIPELLNFRLTLNYFICPLERFSEDSFKYRIVTPHISASAYIEPQVRKYIANLLYNLEIESMRAFNKSIQAATSSLNVPPHLRGRPGQQRASEEINTLPAPIGNGKPASSVSTGTSGQTSSYEVDVDAANSWWALLSATDKIAIASQYILEGHELPSSEPVKCPTEAVKDAWKQSAGKSDETKSVASDACSPLNPAAPEFGSKMVTENLGLAPVVKTTATQDDWNTDTVQEDHWSTAPVQKDIWDTPPVQQAQKANALASPQPTPKVEPITTFQALASSSNPSLGVTEPEDVADFKPGAFIGSKTSGDEQEIFIQFMTKKVIPRTVSALGVGIPKKPILDTVATTENIGDDIPDTVTELGGMSSSDW